MKKLVSYYTEIRICICMYILNPTEASQLSLWMYITLVSKQGFTVLK